MAFAWAGLLFAGGLAVAILVATGGGPALRRLLVAETRRPPTPEERREDYARIRARAIFRDERHDDRTRARIFREEIARRARCDEVLSALIERPGVWVVRCSPGYRYRLEFDAHAEIIAVSRLP